MISVDAHQPLAEADSAGLTRQRDQVFEIGRRHMPLPRILA